MNDLRGTIEAKSDQINYDDLIAGQKTIEITSVKVVSGDQPVTINYKDDNGKPFRPCKSMRRLMILAWGSDGDQYIGKKMTIYGDKNVKWAGQPVGGIRISHMSDLPNNEKLRVMLTETRGRRAPYEVLPLIATPKQTLSDGEFDSLCVEMRSCVTMGELAEVAAKIKKGDYDEAGSNRLREAYTEQADRVRNNGDLI